MRKYDRTYTYDKLGNIKSLVQSGVNGFTRGFVYNNNVNTLNKIQDASQVNIEDYTYDANGNQLTGGTTRNYIWNHANQLISFSGTNVVAQYDYSGQNRVSKFVKNGNDFERTIYIDGVFEYHILEKPSATYQKNYVHVMDDSSRIAEVRIGQQFPNDIADSVVYNLETNIGSSAVRLDSNGTVIDKEEYYPFGDSSLRTFTYKRYRYVGKEKDSESGLYYYGARYYAAWTCRFVSVDPLAADYPFYTPYQYAGNRPINFIDLDGLEPAENKKDFYRFRIFSYSAFEDYLNSKIDRYKEDPNIKSTGTDETLTKDELYKNVRGAVNALHAFFHYGKKGGRET